ncbi:MAG: putative sulfate exporter family transporter [Thermodesulfobacteriaceae bacterium]|nr:putative sulfate exporter family transporter [Thermodesulfobacteriaceae bacterium]MCX8042003.1 putative sulfate exporter family transporter [Thermodesulfobacteriaceae bacterium]MDW8136447.1 putative sulfate exporter family transporter [Thermodesulfobacterium sp.]
MEEPKKGKLNEDWLAFWLAIILFLISLLAYKGVDFYGWVVSTKEWTKIEKAVEPVGKKFKGISGEIIKIEGNKLTIKTKEGKEQVVLVEDPTKYQVGQTYEKKGLSGFTSLVLTYLFLTFILAIGAYLLGAKVGKFIIGFFFIFWLSYLCWLIGHYAYFAATDPAKYNIPWSLKLTGEGGYIFALALGLIIGNFFRPLARFLEEACRPEFYVKTAIGLMGAMIGLKSAEAFGLASAVFFRGLCAIVEAYLIYWALVYYIARRYFKFSKEWSAPLAAGISICGVSAAIAAGGAIKARPVVPIMVASLVVIFAVIELIILPFIAQIFLWKEPMVAGAWMGLAVKTDGAAFASGAITDALIRAKAEVMTGIKYEEGWILMAAATTKLFIDIFISIWAFLLAYLWCAYVECAPGEKVSVREIWRRFPKFVLAYFIGFIVILIISAPHAPKVKSVEEEIKLINKEIKKVEKQLATTAEPILQAQLQAKIADLKSQIKNKQEAIKDSKKIVEQTQTATSGTNALRVIFFLITFFTIGVISDFRKLWAEGLGKLALVYVVCLFGFIIWIGLIISWIFFHGVKPPIVSE